MAGKSNIAPPVAETRNSLKSISAVALATVIIVLGFVLMSGVEEDSTPELIRDVALSMPDELKPFNLISHENGSVGVEQLEGRWTFLFFGFTHCPDVCPATLMQVQGVIREIQAIHGNDQLVQVFFVSVDPARDSVEHLAAYVSYFGPAFTGLTGKADAITLLEKQLGAFHRFGKPGKNGNYEVQHSAEIFLIDPQTRLTAKFKPPLDTSVMVQQFSLIADRFAEQHHKG